MAAVPRYVASAQTSNEAPKTDILLSRDVTALA
jgi:hypothetical protein